MSDHPSWTDEDGYEVRGFYEMMEADDEPYGLDPNTLYDQPEEDGGALSPDEIDEIYCLQEKEEAECAAEAYMAAEVLGALLSHIRCEVYLGVVVSGEGWDFRIARGMAA